MHRLHESGSLVQRHRGCRADRPLGGQADMGHQDVGSGRRHRACTLRIEAVGRGEQVAFPGEPDHLDPEREPHRLRLFQEHGHQAEEIGAADPGQHGVRVTTGRTSLAISTTMPLASPYGINPASHAKPAGIVDANQLGAAFLDTLGRETGARAGADDGLTARHLHAAARGLRSGCCR